MNDPLNNRIVNSLSQNHFSSPNRKKLYNSQNYLYNNVNSISYKNLRSLLNNNKYKQENLLTLPFIEDNKREKNKFSFINMENFRTEFEQRKNNFKNNKNKDSKKTSNYTSYEDLYKLSSLSSTFVKEKFIVFKSPNRPINDPLKLEHDIKYKTKKTGKLTKDYIKNFELNDIEINNAEKKMDYMNINLFNNKIKNKI